MRRRTSNERNANDFDIDTHHLMMLARQYAEDRVTDPRHKKTWAVIAANLAQLRPEIRSMMHHEDRMETAG